MKSKSCFDCVYYDNDSLVCMKDYRVICVLNEWEQFKKCGDFIEGDYNPDLVEKEYTSKITRRV